MLEYTLDSLYCYKIVGIHIVPQLRCIIF